MRPSAASRAARAVVLILLCSGCAATGAGPGPLPLLPAGARDEAGFDLAVVEECVAYDECAAYTNVYEEAVLAVEYPDTLDVSFSEACAAPDTPPATILRDRDLVTPDEPGHIYETC